MARPIIVSINNKNSIFQLKKIERKKLYGFRKRLAIDENNDECKRASLTEDGEVLIKSGMTSQGWFIEEGKQIESNEIGAIDENNNELCLIPSTLGINQDLEGPMNPKDLLDLSVTASYSIIPDEISNDLKIDQEGSTRTSATVLYDLLRKLPSNLDIVFDLQGENKLKISAKNSK